jgi:Tfp pilus assembly protein PilE
LVELLIVVAIIGILAAIAIPQFAAYKERAFCSAEKSDLGNLSIVQEVYFGDYQIYSGDIVKLKNLGLVISPGVTLTTTTDVTVTPAAFTATADHFTCTAPPSQWDSSKGGLQP